MRRLLRWIGISLGILGMLVLVAYAIIYAISERSLRRTYPIPEVAALSIPTDPASIAEGKRLATVVGCLNGCHGKLVEGAVLVDEPLLARLVAPNLTTAVRERSDAELAVAIRHGLAPDGRSLIVMPSEGLVGLTDQDLGRIIAFLRSVPVMEGPAPDRRLGPLARIVFATGDFRTAAELLADARPLPKSTNEEHAQGRYVAQIACSHCHGSDLRGMSNPDFTSPNLVIVAAYSPEQFTKLLRTGIAIGERPLGVMRAVALDNLSHLNDAEIASLYGYLHSLPAEAVK